MSNPRPEPVDRAAVAWALLGACALLGSAAVRLGFRGFEAVRTGLTPIESVVLVILVAVFAIGEGWGALQRRWVPDVVRRARRLDRRAPTHHRALAPLFGMGLIGGTRDARRRARRGVYAVLIAIMAVRMLPEPWRGMVDLSVAGALAWGTLALLLRGRNELA